MLPEVALPEEELFSAMVVTEESTGDSFRNMTYDEMADRIVKLEGMLNFYVPMFWSIIVFLFFAGCFFCVLIIPSKRRKALRDVVKKSSDGPKDAETTMAAAPQSPTAAHSPGIVITVTSAEEADKVKGSKASRVKKNSLKMLTKLKMSKKEHSTTLETPSTLNSSQPATGSSTASTSNPRRARSDRIPDYSSPSEDDATAGSTAGATEPAAKQPKENLYFSTLTPVPSTPSRSPSPSLHNLREEEEDEEGDDGDKEKEDHLRTRDVHSEGEERMI